MERPLLAIRVHARLIDVRRRHGLGSLYFLNPEKPRAQRRFGKCIAKTEFTDVDGVVVSAALNVDQDGVLFELDIWKTDFSPVTSLPC